MAIQTVTNVALLALIAVGAATIPAVLLFMWIGVKGAASNAHQLGRKWLAWTVASLTLTLGTRFIAHNFDLNFLAQWAIGVVVFGGLAYGLGWAYWKLVREKPWKRIFSARMAEPDKDRLYEIAWKEIEIESVDKGLWAKAYAESDGDREKTKARYLKSRVSA